MSNPRSVPPEKEAGQRVAVRMRGRCQRLVGAGGGRPRTGGDRTRSSAGSSLSQMLGRVLAAGGLLDPKSLIDDVGLWGVFAVVFAESGMLVGFFLPGDSLLFTAGFLASGPSSVDEALHLPLGWLLVGTFIAAVAGDQVGYVIGRRAGPAIFNRPDSRLFKQENVDKAHAFFERYGAKTIVLARFVPVVRTFAPVVAGVSNMQYRTFVTFNLVGGLLWAIGVTLLGYFLGQVDFIEENLELAILTIVAISVLPIARELWLSRRQRRSEAPAPEVDRTGA
jgi:membrane-associated protein